MRTRRALRRLRAAVAALVLATAAGLVLAGLTAGSPGRAAAMADMSGMGPMSAMTAMGAMGSGTTTVVPQPPSSAPTKNVALAPAPGAAGHPLSQPRALTSRHGVLNVTLVASQRRVSIAGRPVLAKVYNGSWDAPRLVVSPGDEVRVKLVNRLDEPTNLHFHGLGVAPGGHADNVFVSVDPGHSFQYSFRLPRDAAPGTYWYHSHEMVPDDQMKLFSNADSEEQVFDGLSGLLEVQGLTRDLPADLRRVPQRYLALRDVQVNGDRIATTDIDSAAPTTRLLNGQLQPRIAIAPGQTQLWHIGNIGADIFYKLSLPGYRFDVIAQDGRPVARAHSVSTLLLPPGKRWDVLVRGARPGRATLQTLFYNEGDDQYPRTTLATVVSQGTPRRAAAMPNRISWGQVDLAYAHVVRRRVVVFSENRAGTLFYIDGRAYDPSRIDFRARENTVEQWTIVNHTDETHPFHMHTFTTQLMSVNGVPQAFDGYQDEIVLPPHGYVVARIDFRGWHGETVFHCHILAHEDAGMMANIQVSR